MSEEGLEKHDAEELERLEQQEQKEWQAQPEESIVGGDFLFQPGHGLGFGARARSVTGFGELSSEMTELDLKPGAAVTVHSLDEDSGWPIIQWKDDVGTDRLTTINPEVFAEEFQSVSEGK